VLEGTVAANPWLHYAGAVAGAAIVLAVGNWLKKRAQTEKPAT
jgi:hypothetical protein